MNQIGKNTIAGELLRGFVERIENINAEIKQLQQDKGVVMAEANAANLVPAGITYIVKYLHSMGMAADNPLFSMVGAARCPMCGEAKGIKVAKQKDGKLPEDASA